MTQPTPPRRIPLVLQTTLALSGLALLLDLVISSAIPGHF